MGFFDSISELFAAASPWEESEAEAVRTGGTGTDSTPAQQEGGEGEAKDENEPTPDKKSNDDNQVGGKAASGNDGDAHPDSADDEEEEEEEEEEEIEDPKEKFEKECQESKQCAPAKHHFDECVERVTGAADEDKKGPSENCVEEFFHLAHCANQCAAPKLWNALK